VATTAFHAIHLRRAGSVGRSPAAASSKKQEHRLLRVTARFAPSYGDLGWVAVQHALIDLIDLLDPEYVRSAKSRDRL
jgi:hypothetical protein